jgi:hypothetical protein
MESLQWRVNFLSRDFKAYRKSGVWICRSGESPWSGFMGDGKIQIANRGFRLVLKIDFLVGIQQILVADVT